jgi:hypothetical protein
VLTNALVDSSLVRSDQTHLARAQPDRLTAAISVRILPAPIRRTLLDPRRGETELARELRQRGAGAGGLAC